MKIDNGVQGNKVASVPIFKNYLQALTTLISKNNHGGSLLIIPNELEYSNTLDIKYRLDNTDIHDFLVGKSEFISNYACNNPEKNNASTAIINGYKQYVSTIADFASVDGALVINYDGFVIGYGAEILLNSPAKLTVRFIGPDNVEKKKKITEYGTRHRSAFRFVRKFAGVVCFIFSQDGGIKACFNDNEKVYVYTDIENELEVNDTTVD